MRDPKAMAQTLRRDLAARALKISHSESLELVSHMLGVHDWNTLSAVSREPSGGQRAGVGEREYPAIPVRDAVLPPAIALPLWLKRGKSLGAVEAAFQRRRELVLVMQTSAVIDEPGEDDVHRVGTIAHVLDLGPPSAAAIAKRPELADTTEVLVRPFARARILSFRAGDDAFRARVEQLDEGPIVAAPDLVREAASVFEAVVAGKGISLPASLPALLRTSDPGRYADLLAIWAPITQVQKQEILETFQPIPRLERLLAMLKAGSA
jgi:ATP-dependent Lon protease